MVTNLAAGVDAFTSNAFLAAGDRTVLVDPGANFDAVAAVREHVDDLDAVLVTHPHPDHVGNLDDVKAAFGVDAWGFDASVDGIDHELADGDVVTIGDHEYEALHTPGHEPHHLAFYSPEAGVLFAADLVFANGAFGRTDLEGGDRRTLIESIQYVLDVVDDLEVMHAGHGPSVTDGAIENVEFAAQAARQR
ncbi:MBL fold metallo-hydrolase [Halobacterium sp. CBA1126]|uniref:MBL fold metallo-hydrolase n=1 Tax=Halobacterium TaxID=2239 RepID=UPI0012F90A76|nr:MBL fold metallo-hydrolase [Halobacterium sp. CBA1126]MUV60719.1 MBL fold metallo-hydrolase [Halobacterium sp. CBA1126]